MDAYRRHLTQPSPMAVGQQADRNSLEGLLCDPLDLVERDVRRLFAKHRTNVGFGARHAAPCCVWRAERVQMNRESLPRFANRVHVFQQGDAARVGRYLGYVSLRPRLDRYQDLPFAFTAAAYVALPSHMLRPRYHIVTCVSGPADGVLPFRCVPFCFPNPEMENRANCLHAALHQALLLKMNTFGCTPISSQDMVALLWEMSEGGRSQREIGEAGATLEEALSVLRHQDVRGGGVLEAVTRNRAPQSSDWSVRLEAHRCITDYLANGLPLILQVRAQKPHSVLLFGMHLLHDPEEPSDSIKTAPGDVQVAELPGRFVVHDIRGDMGPFTEISAKRLWDEAWVEDAKQPRESGLYFLAVAPRHASMGILAARRAACRLAMRYDEGTWRDYLVNRIGVADQDAGVDLRDARYVTRLLRTSQVHERYLRTSGDGDDSLSEEAHACIESVKPTKSDYWWAVEARVPHRLLDPVASDEDVPPAFVLLWGIEDDATSDARVILSHAPDERAVLRTREGVVGYVPYPSRA